MQKESKYNEEYVQGISLSMAVSIEGMKLIEYWKQLIMLLINIITQSCVSLKLWNGT